MKVEGLLWIFVIIFAVGWIARYGFEYYGYWRETRARKKVWKEIRKKHINLMRKKDER